MWQLSIQAPSVGQGHGTGAAISGEDAASALMPTGSELTLPTPDISCLSVGAEVVVVNSKRT